MEQRTEWTWGKKLASVFFSFVLAFSLSPLGSYQAFADEPSADDADAAAVEDDASAADAVDEAADAAEPAADAVEDPAAADQATDVDAADEAVDTQLQAAADEDTFTVTFDTDGGTPVPSDQTVKSGEVASQPKAPSKEGYIFGGWYADQDLKTKYDFATPVTADITIYAKWSDKPDYKITVEVIGEDGSTVESTATVDLEAIAGEGPAVTQYKSGADVRYSTSFASIDDILAEAGVEAGDRDVIDFVADDGFSTSKAYRAVTYGEIAEGKYYPKLPAAVGASDAYLVPTGLMLTYAVGSGDTPDAAVAAAQEKEQTFDGCPAVSMGLYDSDLSLSGKRLLNGIVKVQVKRAAPQPAPVTVEVLDINGKVESTTTFDINSLATEGPAVAQFNKGGWNVLRSTSFVPLQDILDEAGVEVGPLDTINFGASDGMNKKFAAQTLSSLQTGKFYPTTVEAGATDAYAVPVGLALTYATGTGDTAADALAAAEKAKASDDSCPRVFMGVIDGDMTTGGNRLWSGVNKIQVQRVAASPVTVEVLDLNGEVESSTKIDLADVAGEGPATAQFNKGGWNVLYSTNFAPLQDILDAAGVEVGDLDTINFGADDGMNKKFAAQTLDSLNTGKFYPTTVEAGAADATAVPVGLALTYGSGTGDTPAEALAIAEKAGQATDSCPRVFMGVLDDDMTTGGNRLWSGVTKVQVQRVAAAPITVKVIDLDGNVESSTLIDASTVAGEGPGIAQYNKGGWQVLYSTSFASLQDILDAADVTVGDLDTIDIGENTKFSPRIMSEYETGKFYPTEVEAGASDAYVVPAGVALTYAQGTGDTPAAALDAAKRADQADKSCPRGFMGVLDSDMTTGGNRLWSGMSTIVVQRVAASPVTVEVLAMDGSVESSKTIDLADVAGEGPVLAQFNKGGWNVLRSTSFATLEDILAAANVTAGEDDTIAFGASDGINFKFRALTLDEYATGKFYPTDVEEGASDAYPVPAGIALTYATGTGDTPAEALAVAEKAGQATDSCPRAFMGIIDGDMTVGGNRLWSNIEKVQVQRVGALHDVTVSVDPSAKGSATLTVNGEEATQARYGDTVAVVLDPAEGYEADGEPTATAADGTAIDVADGSFAMVDQDVAVVQKVKPIEYKITYNLAGGTNAKTNPSTYTVDKKVNFSSPTRKGYVFQGWYISNAKVTGIAAGSTGDKTVVAKWSKLVMPSVSTQAHVQKKGWMKAVAAGKTAGTTGKSLRAEAFKLTLGNDGTYKGGIQYRVHVQKYGWQGWKSNGQLAGTTGKGLRAEAIQIKLTGEAAQKYDVYYRVHVQGIGWMGWAKNGAAAGTTGMSKRAEAIQVKIVEKGDAAPGSTANAYRKK